MKKIVNTSIFCLLFFVSNLAFAALVYDFSNSRKGNKDVEMNIVIHQQESSLDKTEIECETESFKKYYGSAEFNTIDRKLESLYFSLDISRLAIKEKEGNCKRFLDIWSDFYTEKYPKIIFTSNKITDIEKDKYEVIGNLNLQGYVEEIIFQVEAFPFKEDRKLKLKFDLSVDLLDYRTEEEDIFELWSAYRSITAELKFDLAAEN